MVVLIRVRIVGAESPRRACLARLRRIAAQLAIVETEVHRIEPQAIDTLVEPEPQIVEHGRADFGVVEIEIGLRRQEIVQVVLAASRLPLPCDAAENGQPVVGRCPVRPRIGPHIPVGFRIVAARAALAKPRVFARCVTQNVIDDHLEPESMRLREQPLEVSHRAEHGIDIAVIRHVVAEIRHRRFEERRDPDGVDAEARHVVEPVDDALQIADAVAVAVAEAARIDLVDHRAAPP